MEIENQQQEYIFKNIKKIKYKKILLSNFIETINENIYEDNILQKNNLILKTLFGNLKKINENNVIIENGKIMRIDGIDITNDGLMIINDNLYKTKKQKKYHLFK